MIEKHEITNAWDQLMDKHIDQVLDLLKEIEKEAVRQHSKECTKREICSDGEFGSIYIKTLFTSIMAQIIPSVKVVKAISAEDLLKMKGEK